VNDELKTIAYLRHALSNHILDDIYLKYEMDAINGRELLAEINTLLARLAAQEAIMKRAAAVCGSEEDWERIDELVALLHSQYTQERESANQYAQMNYGKLNNIIHELEFLVNKYSFDAKTNTPDYILADYLYECLMNYVEVTWKNDIHRKASDENTNDNN